MDAINGSTKEKLKAVMSDTKASRQTSNVQPSTGNGVKPPMDAKAEAEKMREILARLKDVTHSWSLNLDVTMPAPFISTSHLIVAFPLAGHVIKNAVTSDGKQNFEVDGELVIPVTSEKNYKKD